MSKKTNKRLLVSFSPDINEEPPKALLDFIIDDGRKVGGHLKQIERSFPCRLVKRAHSRVVRFFHRVNIDMANALRSCHPRIKIRRQQPAAASARRVSASMTPPQRFVPSRDSSHDQSEAVEECIKYLKSSSRREVMLDEDVSPAKLHGLLFHNQQHHCF